MITAVTAFVPIPGHPRPEAEYHALGSRLLGMHCEIPLLFAEGDLMHCWLFDRLQQQPEFTHSVSDNPAKNSVAYHIVQAQKSTWLAAAATVDTLADVFCWIDYGIFHVPGVTEQVIIEFLQRAENERLITIPGCWGSDYTYDDDHPCWRFCGGVMLVPREYIQTFDNAMRQEYHSWLNKTNNLSWEVNTLARVEQKYPDMIWHYQADHNQQIFTNYRVTEYADGQRGPRLVAHHESDQRFI